jgi:hypothetical protein
MKLLIAMNLSPRWVDIFAVNHIDAAHWSAIGTANAPDIEIMNYAQRHDILFLPMILTLARYLHLPAQVNQALSKSVLTTCFRIAPPCLCYLRWSELRLTLKRVRWLRLIREKLASTCCRYNGLVQ